jgi:hypothetical protein
VAAFFILLLSLQIKTTYREIVAKGRRSERFNYKNHLKIIAVKASASPVGCGKQKKVHCRNSGR